MDKSKGVLLMAFGNPEYIFMAAQMALSIKVNSPELPIQLVHDDNVNYLPTDYRNLFDWYTKLDMADVYRNATFEPGYAKLKAYQYSKFDQTIFLDVDGICLDEKKLTDVFDLCTSFYHTEVIGSGTLHDTIEYAHWASNINMFEQFGLNKNQTYYAVQSSFQYFKRSKEMDKLAASFIKEFDFPKERLANQWGQSIPDELIIGGACAKINHDPSLPQRITFFGNKGNRKEIAEVRSNFYISSLYGNGKGTKLVMERYVDMYDRLIFKYAREKKMEVIRRASHLMKKKHVG